MRPEQCGTFRPPAEDSPDREAVDQYRQFLAEVDRRGVNAVAADPAWRAYITGAGPPPPDGFTCPKCGRTSHHPIDVREGYCGACHDWTGSPRPPAGPAAVDRAAGTIT